MTTDANDADDSVLTPGQPSNESLDDAIAESSPASEENHEQKPDAVQKRFNKLTYEKHEALRENERLKAEIETKKQSTPAPIVEDKANLKAPELPSDIYDEEAMKQYHADSAKYNAQIAKDAATSTFEQQQKQSQKAAQEVEQRKQLNTYVDNAINDGVNMEKLPMIEQTLNNAGINPQLGQYLISDINGAKVAEYLVDNPAEMYEVLQMDPVSAGIKISTEIKPKALSKTPNVSGAPDPIKEVVGGGYVEKDEFDKRYPGAEFV